MAGGKQTKLYKVDGSLECWNVEQGNPALSYSRMSLGMRLRVGSRS